MITDVDLNPDHLAMVETFFRDNPVDGLARRGREWQIILRSPCPTLAAVDAAALAFGDLKPVLASLCEDIPGPITILRTLHDRAPSEYVVNDEYRSIYRRSAWSTLREAIEDHVYQTRAAEILDAGEAAIHTRRDKGHATSKQAYAALEAALVMLSEHEHDPAIEIALDNLETIYRLSR